MQTFLPYPNFEWSARALDRQRLGKQRLEVLQIYRVLRGETSGWANHPAVAMWRGHKTALLAYGLAICDEWKRRGYRDSITAKLLDYRMSDPEETTLPPWFGREDFHRAHRANLVAKFPEHYRPLFGDLPPEPYRWA